MMFTKIYHMIISEKANKLTEFLTKRKAGAKKIEESSRKKGGLSLLTAAHFKAKDKPYQEAIDKSETQPLEHCKTKALDLLDKLKDIDNISQNDWQKLTGELEAYGEAYIQSLK